MRSSKSKARSHVEIRGLVLLYATTLEARGYRPSVVLAYSAAVEHFISWAASSRARLEVSRDAVQRFLKEHLADCKCPGFGGHPKPANEGRLKTGQRN